MRDADKRLDILSFGEPMVEFAETERAGERLFLPGFGGDVSNTAIAAARQGARTGVFTALGQDTFGQDLMRLWEREGVDCSSVFVREGGSTGIYFITYGPEGHVFTYRRAGSAASLVRPDELPRDLIAEARVLHVSGISQGISQSAADSVMAAIYHAKASRTLVSYDSNLRLALWPLERARKVIHEAMALADIALPGLDDARQLTGESEPDAICDTYLGMGCRIVALTLGSHGTLVATPEARRLMPAYPVQAVDATGAGDAFDGAFLADWLRHGDPFQAASYANAAAALSTLGKGAVAPLPRRPEVEAFLAAQSAGAQS